MKRTLLMAVASAMAVSIVSANQVIAETAVVGSVKVHTTRAGGGAWDPFGGAPDLRVDIRRGGIFGPTRRTSTKSNTFSAFYGESTVRVSAGDRIRIRVYDVDPLNPDDLIGEYTTTVSAGDIRSGLFLTSFGRVINLSITFGR